jgi:hypothetical protein
MEDVIIWDDPTPTRKLTPEQLSRRHFAIRVWFDEMVESGKIQVLTVNGKYGRVTYIRAGSARNDLED